jgi:peptidoglycan/LPS O-acetylase OafA/YrhL
MQKVDMESMNLRIPSKSLLRILVGTVLVLLIPLVAMQFSSDVDWNLTDFVIMGLLLLVTGAIYELAVLRVKSSKRRAVVAAMVLVVFLLIWAELTVGIFGTPIAGS